MNRWKRNRQVLIRAVVIIGVIIIPLMYSYFYLGAFWDPYSRLEDLPVAIVNSDKGATINKVKRNLGNEMCDELKEDGTLKFIITDQADANDGTKRDQYYATIHIPENFSSCIASAESTNKQIAQINFSSNEKRNYLASQILGKAVDQIEIKLRGKINSEIVATLCEQLDSTPDQLTTLADGLQKLSDGTGTLKDGVTRLKDGTVKLKDGTNTLEGKLSEFSSGTNKIYKGSIQLEKGVNDLQKGIDTLAKGSKKLKQSTKDINQLKTKSKTLSDGASTFNQGLIQYTNGVDSLITSVESTSSFLKSYVATHPTILQDSTFVGFLQQMNNPSSAASITALKQSTAQIRTSSASLATGTKLLSDATMNLPTLKKGISDLNDGLICAQRGATKLGRGTKTLSNGLGQLDTASQKLSSAGKQLSNGAAKVDDGTSKLSDGATKLDDGANNAVTQVTEKIDKATTELLKLNGLDDFSNTPVEIVSSPVDSVPNYGTAFAPYFLCLSLWVGALIIFFGIYLDADNKFKLLSRSSEQKTLRCFIYLGIGLAQALVLGIVLKYCLGLEINNIFVYYLTCGLVSMVFISIVQFFLLFFKDVGKFLAIAMLILQLTSCGGTFPMETVPGFFNVLYPFMPMTYAVGLLKESISGSMGTTALFNTTVLVCILLVFIGTTLLLSILQRKKQ